MIDDGGASVVFAPRFGEVYLLGADGRAYRTREPGPGAAVHAVESRPHPEWKVEVILAD